MNTNTKKTIDNLTTEGVSILTQKFTSVDGIEAQVGENHRCAYSNSAGDRDRLIATEPDEVVATVLTVWGAVPTVEEPEVPVYTPTREEILEEQLEASDEAVIELYESQIAQDEALAAQDEAIIELYELLQGGEEV